MQTLKTLHIHCDWHDKFHTDATKVYKILQLDKYTLHLFFILP